MYTTTVFKKTKRKPKNLRLVSVKCQGGLRVSRSHSAKNGEQISRFYQVWWCDYGLHVVMCELWHSLNLRLSVCQRRTVCLLSFSLFLSLTHTLAQTRCIRGGGRDGVRVSTQGVHSTSYGNHKTKDAWWIVKCYVDAVHHKLTGKGTLPVCT